MISYLRTSSESNQEIQIKGRYNKEDNKIFIQSLKLGNLEERFLNAEMAVLKLAK